MTGQTAGEGGMSRVGLLRFGVAALILGLVGGMPGPARAFDAPLGKRPFDILINGVKVGHLSLTFVHQGKDLVVEDEIYIAPREFWHNLADRALDVLRIGVGLDKQLSDRYVLRCREVWRDSALAEVTTNVDDYGQPVEVDLDATPSGLMVKGPAGQFPAPPGLVPSSLWNIEMTKAPAVLDLNSGRILHVNFTQGAPVPIPSGTEDIPAIHVTATGGLSRDLWYAGDILLREQYVDEKGQLIEIRSAP